MCVSCGLFEKCNEKEIKKRMCVCVVFVFTQFFVCFDKEKGNIKCNKKCIFFAYDQYFKNIKNLIFANLLFTVGIRINKS